MVRKRVAVVFGGSSVEREVSRVSARAILEGLSGTFDTVPAGVDSSGRLRSEENSRILLERGFEAVPSWNPDEDSRRVFAGVDVAFPIIHGEGGEDGTLQGFFETIGLPYVGSGVAASALGMNKAAFKARMRDAGLPVTRSFAVTRSEWEGAPGAVADLAAWQFPPPIFVKPSGGGSSLGVSKVKEWEGFGAAVGLALEYDDTVLIEEAIDAREIECGVLGNDDAEASGCAEIVPGREFYDYEDKYLSEGAQLLMPAPLDDAVVEAVRRISIRAFHLCGCSGLARVDFFLDRASGRLVLNELNTLPGFTSISQYPRLWERAGVPMPDLLERLVLLGAARFEQRRAAAAKRGKPPRIG